MPPEGLLQCAKERLFQEIFFTLFALGTVELGSPGKCQCEHHGGCGKRGQRGTVWGQLRKRHHVCIPPRQIQTRESIRKAPGAALRHHTPNHRKVLLETPRNDSPFTHSLLLGACPCASGWHGEPVPVDPETCVPPGRKQWVAVV